MAPRGSGRVSGQGMADHFEAIVEEHGSMIARIAASYEADRELARDLTQDVLLAVWRALPGFRGDSSVRTFVARIAHNRAITHVASAAREPEPVELGEGTLCPLPHPEAETIAGDRARRLIEAVRRLPLAYRQVATLTLEDFTPAEIAQTLGLTANAVSIRLTRAKALLRTLLGDAA